VPDKLTLRDVLLSVEALPAGWLYLPKGEKWNLDTPAFILQDEEVSPEEEDEPLAGYPRIAKDNNLRRVLFGQDVRGIVENAKQQKPNVTLDELLTAFHYYFERDAFMKFAKP
jgi:hypothetical protein